MPMMLRSTTPHCFEQITILSHDIVESMHTLSIKFSYDSAVFRYDGEEVSRIPDGIPCEMFCSAFRIYTFISSSYDENSIKYRLIRLEKFRD